MTLAHFGALRGRCCKTLTVDDSHREAMRLDRPYEHAITLPLSHDELEVLQRCTQAARLTFNLAGQGHGVNLHSKLTQRDHLKMTPLRVSKAHRRAAPM
jgi:hypothetical protein